MNKIKNIIGLIIILFLLTLVGCSTEKTQEVSTQIELEETNYIQEAQITESKETEYIQVVLNSGWEERLRKQNELNNLSNNENRREESVQQAEETDEQSKEDSNSNNQENEETINTEDEEETINEVIDYPYYIKINYQANVVNIYTKDENGEYTVPYKAMLCSTGTATPRSGVYSIIYKYRWLEMLGGVYAQYCSQVVGNILIHSVPYSTLYDNGSLQYWSYDKLGKSVSAGCIRLTVGNAKWIYDNCPNGTPVEFYASSDPGPFGTPEEMKISSYTQYRNWDPTDPNENNPWRNYVQQSGTITN